MSVPTVYVDRRTTIGDLAIHEVTANRSEFPELTTEGGSDCMLLDTSSFTLLAAFKGPS